MRWAVADKREIESAINAWSEGKIEAAIKAEKLSADEAEKLRQYEAVDTQLMELLTRRSLNINPATGRPWPSETDAQAEKELRERLAQARAPIAPILDRRDRLAAQFRKQYNAEQLTAEYVKDRFDLVIDSSEMHSSISPVLYRRPGEALDITEGILKLFKEKTQP